MGRVYERDWVERAHSFAVRVVRLANKLPRTAVGFAVAGQITRAVQGITYNLEEARATHTEADTLNKTINARKESAETRRALMLIRDVPLISGADAAEVEYLVGEGNAFVAMLTSGTKRLQLRLERNGNGTVRRVRPKPANLDRPSGV